MSKGRFQIANTALFGVTAVTADTRHSFPRHTHDTFGIGIIRRGAQKSLSGRGIVEAGPGDIITVNPGEVHDGAPIGDHGRFWQMLYLLPGTLAAAALDITDGGRGTFEFEHPVIRDARLAGRFRQLFAATTAENGVLLESETELVTLIASVLQPRTTAVATKSAGIRRAARLLDDDPAHPTTLTDLAHEAGLGKFQLLRAFVRQTGFTPHAYQIQRRIDMARRMIDAGSPLAEAAVASGFADQSHMTRAFVQRYGVTPGAYAAAVH
ncbi:AraC family transcriptional regulator [Ciceribacter ferrooxidans]|uniref:AraC family transcriptional regulator n=1 Tax=Ciceribacter ferrooxidans TaxID=2509717 RepID=A0A4Q2SZU0_9HYPH|nr:AraC family transcriptional regulator [Ciceribacter ferrooxidans]RYC09898.1 AraC family transcriptional regulator [Ciceribacter ferrooxidans]